MQQLVIGKHVPLEAVRASLTRVQTPALDIYKDTDLTPAWQQAFIEGRSKDPAYSRIIKLIDWLARTHMEVLTEECLTRQ